MHVHLRIAKILTDLLDNAFRIGKFRFGLDPILGAIPIIGDIIPVGAAFYMVWIGKKMDLPQEKINKMVQNILIDFFLGVIPVFGDVSDFVFRAHAKNLAILKEHTGEIILEGKVIS